MNKFTLIFACLAWLESTTVSASDNPHPHSPLDDLVIRRLGIHPNDVIHVGDTITIQKILNGNLVSNDIVKGVLQRIDFSESVPNLYNPEYRQYGAAKVIINPHNHFFVRLTGTGGYVDHGRNEGEATYFCTIERNDNIILVAALRNPHRYFVPVGRPRIMFVNKSHASFTGELMN